MKRLIAMLMTSAAMVAAPLVSQTVQGTATSGQQAGADGTKTMSWEYGPVVQGGTGVTDNRGGFKFIMAGVHVGKVLTPELGRGFFKGQFEFAGEFYPFWQSYTPKFQRADCNTSLTVCTKPYTLGGTFTGMTLTPVIFRWNLTGHKRFMPWAQAAGGLLWTNHKYPPFGSSTTATITAAPPNSDTSVWNFTPQGGVGIHYFVKPRRSIDFGANAIHISSASLGDKNPGVNASVQFTVGYTWWKQ